MAIMSGRVAAYRHNASDLGTSTTIFFVDGRELTVDGHVHFPHNMTFEVRYQRRNDPEPHKIKQITAVAG